MKAHGIPVTENWMNFYLDRYDNDLLSEIPVFSEYLKGKYRGS
jgi:hypothetical protein